MKGSYDPNYIYIGKMKNGNWKPCKIIEVSKKERIEKENTKIIKAENYKYYVHFLGINRRMDNWISYEEIKKTNHTIRDLKNYRNKENKLFMS